MEMLERQHVSATARGCILFLETRAIFQEATLLPCGPAVRSSLCTISTLKESNLLIRKIPCFLSGRQISLSSRDHSLITSWPRQAALYLHCSRDHSNPSEPPSTLSVTSVQATTQKKKEQQPKKKQNPGLMGKNENNRTLA